MEKIDYTTRAYFEEFSSEDTDFIHGLIETYGIGSILDIPCANGRNLSVIGDGVALAFFADINPKMADIVQNKISKERRTNCTALVLDMRDLSSLSFEVDTILIMQQSFQMLSTEEGKKALQNLQKAKYKRIIIDIYDFLKGAEDIPKFLYSPSVFTDNEGRSWIRRSSISCISNNLVYITHEYGSDEKACIAEVSLYNYSRTEFLSLCKECGYTIYDYYTDYSFGKNPAMGRTIFVIEKPEGKAL